jgi:branched-chain amino acid transport system ATP-binding protein
MLQLDDVVAGYGRVPAVRGVTLHVNAGELVGVVGPNGAGKSTTLTTVMGFRKPMAGTITFDEKPLNELTPEVIARRGVALVPEGRQIFAKLTVAENLRLGATARRDRRGVDADCEGLLDRFPALRKRYGRAAGGLSGGEQQQLAIARALISRPRLIMLDEPSLGLSPQMTDAVYDTLSEMKEEGLTILLVEQNVLRTIELADRTYILRNGRIALVGTAEELMQRDDIASHILGL